MQCVRLLSYTLPKRDDWKFPGAIGIDIADTYYNGKYHALNLPNYIIGNELYDEIPDNLREDAYDISKVDYIFSSHCLEHIPDWVSVLNYWLSKLKPKGTLFLYLPSYDQTYWRPWSDRAHFHAFFPIVFKDYFEARNDVENIFISGVDLNSSFMVMVEKI